MKFIELFNNNILSQTTKFLSIGDYKNLRLVLKHIKILLPIIPSNCYGIVIGVLVIDIDNYKIIMDLVTTLDVKNISIRCFLNFEEFKKIFNNLNKHLVQSVIFELTHIYNHTESLTGELGCVKGIMYNDYLLEKGIVKCRGTFDEYKNIIKKYHFNNENVDNNQLDEFESIMDDEIIICFKKYPSDTNPRELKLVNLYRAKKFLQWIIHNSIIIPLYCVKKDVKMIKFVFDYDYDNDNDDDDN